MGEELELRGLISLFYKMNKRAKKYCVYYQPLNNNLIVFSPYDDVDISDDLYNLKYNLIKQIKEGL